MILGEATTPDDTRLYAIGDIHGCLDELRLMFSRIEDDLKHSPSRHYQIITIGDYCDRGPDSAGAIDLLIEKSTLHPMVCLLGNHDQRFCEFLEIPDEVGERFLHYGGRQTLSSYGIEVSETSDLRGLASELRGALPGAHKAFYQNLSLSHQAGDYFFAHAGVRPQRPLDDQSPDDLLWIRERFLIHQKPHPKVIVHGHTIHPDFDIQPNRINVDTGCFETGILSCIVLEGRAYRKLQVQAD